jgi:ADP-ribosylglycohydrolase
MDDQRLHRGTGSGFRSSVAAFAGDADPEMSGRTDRAGNGAAMRIAPTAIATRNQTDDAFVDQLVAVSLITHREIRALSGMLAVAYVARACAEHSNTPSPAEARKVLEDLLVWLPRQEAKLAEHPAVVDAGERLHEISDAFAGVLDRWDTEWSSIQAQIESFASVRRGSVTRLGEGFVTASVVGAVAWSLASRSSLQDRLIEAVGFGDDADTFAAMVGGLTGPWTNPQALLGRWGTMAGSDELIAWGRSLDSDVPTDTLPDLVELETRLTALVRAG